MSEEWEQWRKDKDRAARAIMAERRVHDHKLHEQEFREALRETRREATARVARPGRDTEVRGCVRAWCVQ